MDRLFKCRASRFGKISGKLIKGELPKTCTTYLKEWYANDNEQIVSKYLDKGNAVEDDCIDFMATVLGYGIAQKNRESKEDEYFTGTCDVELIDAIVDTKAPWNNKTLLDNIDEMDSDYEGQGRVYMRLYNKPKFILFYGLMDTPEFANYGNEVSFAHLSDDERWIGYSIERDLVIEAEMIQRVKDCRIWLENYDKLVKSKIGRLHNGK